MAVGAKMWLQESRCVCRKKSLKVVSRMFFLSFLVSFFFFFFRIMVFQSRFTWDFFSLKPIDIFMTPDGGLAKGFVFKVMVLTLGGSVSSL